MKEADGWESLTRGWEGGGLLTIGSIVNSSVVNDMFAFVFVFGGN